VKRGTLHRKVSGLETIYKVRDTRIEYKDEFKKGHLKEEWDTGERRERERRDFNYHTGARG